MASKAQLAIDLLNKVNNLDPDVFFSEAATLLDDPSLIGDSPNPNKQSEWVQTKYGYALKALTDIIKHSTTQSSTESYVPEVEKESPDFVIEGKSTTLSNDTVIIDEKTANFLADVKRAGLWGIDQNYVDELKRQEKIPSNATGQDIIIALNLYSKGIDSTSLIEKVVGSDDLPFSVKKRLYETAFLVAVFEESDPELTTDLRKANGNPEVSIRAVSNLPNKAAENQILFHNEGGNKITPYIPMDTKNDLFDVKNRVLGFANQSFSNPMSMVAKKMFEKTADAGKKAAIKAAATATGMSVEAAVASTGVGAIPIAILKAYQIVKGIVSSVGNLIGKGLRRLLGNENYEKLRKLKNIIFGAFTLFVSPNLIAKAKLIIGAVGSMVTKALSAVVGEDVALALKKGVKYFTTFSILGLIGALIGIPLVALSLIIGVVVLAILLIVELITAIAQAFFFGIILIISLIAFVYIIIQMGAYVVPPGGFGPEAELSIHGEFDPAQIDPGIPGPNFPREGSLPPVTQYININKRANATSFENDTGEHQVTYTIEVCAPNADVTLREMFCSNRAISRNGSITLDKNEEPPVNNVTVQQGNCTTFQYQTGIDTDRFNDTAIIDQCCILGLTEGSNRGACAQASILIGEYPSCLAKTGFTGVYDNSVQQAMNLLLTSPQFMNAVCSCGDWCEGHGSPPTVNICQDPIDARIGSHALGHQCAPGCDILLDTNGMYGNNTPILVAHELTHHIQACNNTMTDCFNNFPGLATEGDPDYLGYVTLYAYQRHFENSVGRTEDMAEAVGYYFGNRAWLAEHFPAHLRAVEQCVLGL